MAISLKTSEEIPWSTPLIVGLLCTGIVCSLLFVVVEWKVAAFPIMPAAVITRRTPFAVAMANFFGSTATFSTVCHCLFLFLRLTGDRLTLRCKIYNVPLVSLLVGNSMSTS